MRVEHKLAGAPTFSKISSELSTSVFSFPILVVQHMQLYQWWIIVGKPTKSKLIKLVTVA